MFMSTALRKLCNILSTEYSTSINDLSVLADLRCDSRTLRKEDCLKSKRNFLHLCHFCTCLNVRLVLLLAIRFLSCSFKITLLNIELLLFFSSVDQLYSVDRVKVIDL